MQPAQAQPLQAFPLAHMHHVPSSVVPVSLRDLHFVSSDVGMNGSSHSKLLSLANFKVYLLLLTRGHMNGSSHKAFMPEAAYDHHSESQVM